MLQSQEDVTVSPLSRADGSAACSGRGYTVVGAINGPVEVQRRDELPNEAYIDVLIRPASGVAGLREKHLESIVQNTLRRIIITSAHPRTLIQVTLQILKSPGHDIASTVVPQAASDIHILPFLLETATMALLTTSIPMSATMTSILIAAVGEEANLVPDPLFDQLEDAHSRHVFAFSSLGHLLVCESDGHFDSKTWEEAYHKAECLCKRGVKIENDEGSDQDTNMDDPPHATKEQKLVSVIQAKVNRQQRYKG